MIGKILDIIWVIMNTYLIISYGYQIYQYYSSGDIGKAAICLCLGIGFVLLTILIIYRNIRDAISKRKYFKDKIKEEKPNINYDDENIDDVLEQIKEIREETTKDGKVFTVLDKYR